MDEQTVYFDGLLTSDAHRNSRDRIREMLSESSESTEGVATASRGVDWIASAWSLGANGEVAAPGDGILYVAHRVATSETLTSFTMEKLLQKLRDHLDA